MRRPEHVCLLLADCRGLDGIMPGRDAGLRCITVSQRLCRAVVCKRRAEPAAYNVLWRFRYCGDSDGGEACAAGVIAAARPLTDRTTAKVAIRRKDLRMLEVPI